MRREDLEFIAKRCETAAKAARELVKTWDCDPDDRRLRNQVSEWCDTLESDLATVGALGAVVRYENERFDRRYRR